jgi:hypothetical protein
MDAAADDGAAVLRGRRRSLRPSRTQRAGEFLRRRVVRTGEGEQPAPLMTRHLRHDMGSGAKAVETGGLRYLQRFATVKLGPFPSYPDEPEQTSSPNTRRKIVSTCLR